ncbi:unnamed protein product [Rotaria sp. Silwood1]|nr:unnamed protein product [Rotaria sp. Silwood1]
MSPLTVISSTLLESHVCVDYFTNWFYLLDGRFDQLRTFPVDFVTNKVEEKTGMDINRDGRVGGGGATGQIEKATHMDLNRDGVIGGQKTSGSGGLMGKVEKITHMDLNRDGRIGGGAAHQKH